jgi:hypothetical protein
MRQHLVKLGVIFGMLLALLAVDLDTAEAKKKKRRRRKKNAAVAEEIQKASFTAQDADSLRRGKIHALVFADAMDKREAEGYLHIYPIMIESLGRERERIGAQASTGGATGQGGVLAPPTPGRNPHPQALPQLKRALNEYTRIKADMVGSNLDLMSNELFAAPFILANTDAPFTLTRREAVRLGAYLLNGGFVYSDDARVVKGGGSDKSLRKMFADALETQGLRPNRHWMFERLDNDHPLYHSYFDFSGPPSGWDNLVATTTTTERELGAEDEPRTAQRSRSRNVIPVEYIEGVAYEGRLIGIHSMKNFPGVWSMTGQGFSGEEGRQSGLTNVDRQRQFAINVVVFALTQPGSITDKVRREKAEEAEKKERDAELEQIEIKPFEGSPAEIPAEIEELEEKQ